MKEKICSRFNTYEEEIVNHIIELVSIASVPTHSAREGVLTSDEIVRALEYTLSLAQSIGFKTTNVDNEYGYAEIGQGERCIGVFLHLDVVAPGSGWSKDPYICELEDGKLNGRGVLDNKSPTVTCLYAVKTLIDLEVELPCRIRFFFGTCEETGMADIKRYVEEHGSPTASFVPDSQFPLAYCEKGVLFLKLSKKGASCEKSSIRMTDFSGGDARNMVPDNATAKLICNCEELACEIAEKLKVYAKENELDLVAAVDGCTVQIESKGVSGHANEPHKGVNAVLQLAFFIHTLKLEDGRGEIITFLVDKITQKFDGEGMGLAMSGETGELVSNLSSFELTSEGAEFMLNIRHPAHVPTAEVMEKVSISLSENELVLEHKNILPSVYLDRTSPVVKLLYDVYQDITGDSTPMKACGATYAKFIENAVPYGAIFDQKYDKCHHVDEYVLLEHVMLSGQIYTVALYEMLKNIDSL